MMERKLGLVGRVLAGLVVVGGVVGLGSLGGCVSQEVLEIKREVKRKELEHNNLERELYDFVESLATKIPEEFEKAQSGSGERVYYDKSLKIGIEDFLFKGDMPMHGVGRFVGINSDGDISVGYGDSENRLIGFYYDKDDNECIIFSKNYYDKSGSMVTRRLIHSYSGRKRNFWSEWETTSGKFGEGKSFFSMEGPVDEAELKEAFELIEKIRETYSEDN